MNKNFIRAEILTFEQLPYAISRLTDKVDNLERILLNKNKSDLSSELPDDLMTIKEVAKFLNLKVPTIYGLVHQSAIPVCKKGRLYFSRKDIIEWVKTGRKKTNQELEAEADNYLKQNKRKW